MPEPAQRRVTHPALRFIPLVGAPPVPVQVAVASRTPGVLVRRFLDAATRAAAGLGESREG